MKIGPLPDLQELPYGLSGGTGLRQHSPCGVTAGWRWTRRGPCTLCRQRLAARLCVAGGAGPLARAAGDCSAVSPPRGEARWGPLGPPLWGARGPDHGACGGRPLPTVGGVGGRLDWLEPKVSSDKACVPNENDGVTAVSRPVSALRPSMVSKLSEDSGSRASDVSLADILN